VRRKEGRDSLAAVKSTTYTRPRFGIAFALQHTMLRTYFVKGHRIDAYRNARGYSSWACDCAEYWRLRARGVEGSCEHLRAVTAASDQGRVTQDVMLT